MFIYVRDTICKRRMSRLKHVFAVRLLCIPSPLCAGLLKLHFQQLLFVFVKPGLLDPFIPLLVPALQHPGRTYEAVCIFRILGVQDNGGL